MQDTPTDSAFDFPCEFPIKAMGRAAGDFEGHVAGLVRSHVADLPDDAVTSRHSRHGNYLAVTVRIIAVSRAQLDAVYQDLSADRRVLVAL